MEKQKEIELKKIIKKEADLNKVMIIEIKSDVETLKNNIKNNGKILESNGKKLKTIESIINK